MKDNGTTILVVGDAEEAATLFSSHGTAGIRFSRCARDADMAAVLSQPGRRYDWILVDATSFAGDEKDFVRSLRVTGSFIQDSFNLGGHRRDRRPCGVEWLADGSLQMHCCMRTSIRKPCIASRFDSAGTDSVVFEYQAPVKRAK